MGVTDGYYHYTVSTPSYWFHVAIVFHRPDESCRQGMSIYHDGFPVGQDECNIDQIFQKGNGSGTLIIGRSLLDRDRLYIGVMFDELTLWDRKLLEQKIREIANMA